MHFHLAFAFFSIQFLENAREQWAKKRPDLLPKPEQQGPGTVKPSQSGDSRLPSRPQVNTASGMKPTRPGSQSIGSKPLHAHSQLASVSGGSSKPGFSRPSSLSNSRPKPMEHLNEQSQEDDSNEQSLGQWQSPNRPASNDRPRPGSQSNHGNSMARPGNRPIRRPIRRPTRRPLRPRPEYASYHDDQYSDYPDQQYYEEDYDEHQQEDNDDYAEDDYPDEYEEEEQPLPPRPRPTSGGGLLSKLVGIVGKLIT